MTRLLLICACAAVVLTPLAASVAEPILKPARPAAETGVVRTAAAELPAPVVVPAAPQAAAAPPACATRKVRVVGPGYGEPVLPACRTDQPVQPR